MKNYTKYLEIFRLENLTATTELAILCGVTVMHLLLHVIQYVIFNQWWFRWIDRSPDK